VTARKSEGSRRLSPAIRYAPIGEIEIYEVERKEPEQLASGSTASLYLNFPLFLLGIAATLSATLLSTSIPSERVFYGFLNVSVLTWISGSVLLALWWHDHAKSKDLLVRIMNRMPTPPAPVQDSTADPAGS